VVSTLTAGVEKKVVHHKVPPSETVVEIHPLKCRKSAGIEKCGVWKVEVERQQSVTCENRSALGIYCSWSLLHLEILLRTTKNY
jgi:hypothetical protein